MDTSDKYMEQVKGDWGDIHEIGVIYLSCFEMIK